VAAVVVVEEQEVVAEEAEVEAEAE